jgi:hypothetical protein
MKRPENFTVLPNRAFFPLLLMTFFLLPLSVIATDSTFPTAAPPVSDLKSSAQPNPVESTTTSGLSTPTEGGQTEWCPISIIFEEDHHQQELLKEFRDVVLTQHEKGGNYTKLYYLHSPEITLIILTNNEVKTHAQKVLSEMLPIAKDLLGKREAYLSEPLLNDVDALLNEIAHKASPSLREVIKMAKSDIIKKDIFEELNITITK